MYSGLRKSTDRSFKMSLKSSNNVETNVYALEIEIDAATFEAAQNKAFNTPSLMP